MSKFPRINARRRTLLAVGVLLVAIATVWSSAAMAASSSPSAAAASAPVPEATTSASVPRPVAVTVNPATTAVLVLDLNSVVCAPNPSCVATLPAVATLLARARAAGALVVYSNTTTAGATILPQVAPKPGDPIVEARADKFYGTDLQQILSSHGIQTVVIAGGTGSNGAVLYTTFEANLRGYTAVVAENGVSAASGYILRYSLYQLVNEPGFPNADNTPLLANSVTLSTTSQVTFQAPS